MDRSGARSETTANASAPPEVPSTSGATDHDERSWFAFNGFTVSREWSIRFPFLSARQRPYCNNKNPHVLASPSTKGFTKNSEPDTSAADKSCLDADTERFTRQQASEALEIVEESLQTYWDLTQSAARLQGLLGVEWYWGGIENQGSGLLHCHVCVRVEEWPQWLKNNQPPAMPPPPLQEEEGEPTPLT